MIHALRMFAVNMFADIGLISGRALHQIENSVYTSRRSRVAKTATFRPKQLYCEKNASSNIFAKLYPNWSDQGDTWVRRLYLTPFDCLWNLHKSQIDLNLSYH